MRDQKYGAVLHEPLHRLEKDGFGSDVDGARRLIQNEDRGHPSGTRAPSTSSDDAQPEGIVNLQSVALDFGHFSRN